MSADRPLVLIDPDPRNRAMILSDAAFEELQGLAEIVAWWEGGRMPDAMVEEHLQHASVVIGQTHLPRARLDRAPKLRAVINVKGNWEPFVDYAACQARGIPVLSIAPAMAPAVAEWSLAAAIDLLRGITSADRDFRDAKDRYGIRGNENSRSLFSAKVGLVGYGNLGRALRPLLTPFGCEVLVHDPFLPNGLVEEHGCRPVALEELLAEAEVIFVLAGVTAANEGFLSAEKLRLIREDAAVILASRAEVVDFPTLVELAEAGRFRLAVDVFPVEPVPADDPVRASTKILLSAHRAGGIWPSYRRISDMMMDDLRLILRGLPPVRLQRAEPTLAATARSR